MYIVLGSLTVGRSLARVSASPFGLLYPRGLALAQILFVCWRRYFLLPEARGMSMATGRSFAHRGLVSLPYVTNVIERINPSLPVIDSRQDTKGEVRSHGDQAYRSERSGRKKKIDPRQTCHAFKAENAPRSTRFDGLSCTESTWRTPQDLPRVPGQCCA